MLEIPAPATKILILYNGRFPGVLGGAPLKAVPISFEGPEQMINIYYAVITCVEHFRWQLAWLAGYSYEYMVDRMRVSHLLFVPMCNDSPPPTLTHQYHILSKFYKHL